MKFFRSKNFSKNFLLKYYPKYFQKQNNYYKFIITQTPRINPPQLPKGTVSV
uniref:Uncharacterized protein n=1 Tax=Meloidogyne enterolobii TaxID=390850 RepID=A0A6V7X7P5_MELEN|nr:unnamed protein product [Meloidogyne enterolobii]